MTEQLYYNFPCGCRFHQLNETIKNYDGLPPLEIDYYNIPLDCQATWNLLGTGNTRGVFQLESNLGRSHSKKLGPDSIEQLAALTAIIRPAVANAMLDGKSMTSHFIERRHGREPVSYIDERLERYLKTTYGILVYQEQIMAISRGLAGYSVLEAYKLQKGTGKKDAKLLFSMKESFLDGCSKNGVPKEIADSIFENIQAAARYSFCRGHAISYGLVSYCTAYAKAHFPLHFLCSSLKHVGDKDELKDLMSEVSLFDITVKNPSISNLSSKFTIKDGYIQYGYGDIKDVGKDSVNIINRVIEIEKLLGKEAVDFTWYEFLILVSPNVCKTTVNNLIMCGLLDHTGISRTRQLHEYNTFLSMMGQKVKVKWIVDNYSKYDSLLSALEGLLAETKVVKKGKKEETVLLVNEKDANKLNSLVASLKNPGKSLDDSPYSLYKVETELMGVAISADPIGKKERLANITCLQFSMGKGVKNLTFVTVVKSVDERVVKTGKNINSRYANIKLSDKTGTIESTVFSKEWLDLKSLLVEGNVVLVRGKRNDDGGLRVESVEVL